MRGGGVPPATMVFWGLGSIERFVGVVGSHGPAGWQSRGWQLWQLGSGRRYYVAGPGEEP